MHLFSVIIAIGASFGLWRIFMVTPPAQVLKNLLIGIWVLLGSLVGARAGYVLEHLPFFSQHQDQTVKIWLGGLHGYGALVGAVLFAAAAALLLKMNFLKLLDLMSRMILPLAVAAWLGCWAVGVAYGNLLGSGTWWGLMTMDEAGISSLRVPLQPLAVITLIVTFLLVERLTGKSHPGILFAADGLALSIHTLLFSLLRADPVQRLYNIRLDVFLSIPFALIFFILWVSLLPGSQRKRYKMVGYEPEKEV